MYILFICVLYHCTPVCTPLFAHVWHGHISTCVQYRSSVYRLWVHVPGIFCPMRNIFPTVHMSYLPLCSASHPIGPRLPSSCDLFSPPSSPIPSSSFVSQPDNKELSNSTSVQGRTSSLLTTASQGRTHLGFFLDSLAFPQSYSTDNLKDSKKGSFINTTL